MRKNIKGILVSIFMFFILISCTNISVSEQEVLDTYRTKTFALSNKDKIIKSIEEVFEEYNNDYIRINKVDNVILARTSKPKLMGFVKGTEETEYTFVIYEKNNKLLVTLDIEIMAVYNRKIQKLKTSKDIKQYKNIMNKISEKVYEKN